MTVNELIEELKKVDGNKEVYVNTEFDDCAILNLDEGMNRVELVWS